MYYFHCFYPLKGYYFFWHFVKSVISLLRWNFTLFVCVIYCLVCLVCLLDYSIAFGFKCYFAAYGKKIVHLNTESQIQTLHCNTYRGCSWSHCLKSVRIRSYSDPYFLAFGLHTDRYEVCENIRTRITSNTDTFHAVPSIGEPISAQYHSRLW